MNTPDIFLLLFLLSLLLPALRAGLIYKRSDTGLRPMLLFVILVFLLSAVSIFSPQGSNPEIIASRLESLLSLLLITWQARRWHVFDEAPFIYRLIMTGAPLSWLIEFILVLDEPAMTSWFDIGSCYLIALMGIDALTKALIRSRGRVFRDPVVLFSIALIFNYCFEGMMELFSQVIRASGAQFLARMYYLYMTIAILAHCIYLYALLCISAKTNYSISSSQPS